MSSPDISAMLTAFKQICKDLRSFGNSDYKKKVKKCLQQLIMMNFSLEMVMEHHLKKLVDAIPWKTDLKLMVLAKIERLEKSKKRPANPETSAAKKPSPPVITPFGNGYRIPKKPKAQLAQPIDNTPSTSKLIAPIVIDPKAKGLSSISQETKKAATSEIPKTMRPCPQVLAPMNGYRIPKRQPLKPIASPPLNQLGR